LLLTSNYNSIFGCIFDLQSVVLSDSCTVSIYFWIYSNTSQNGFVGARTAMS